MASKKDTLMVIGRYLEVYPQCKLEKEGLRLYVNILNRFDVDVLDKAFLELVVTSKYFPSIAEICEMAKKLTPPPKPMTAREIEKARHEASIAQWKEIERIEAIERKMEEDAREHLRNKKRNA